MAPLFKSYVQGKILNTPIELPESQSKALPNTHVGSIARFGQMSMEVFVFKKKIL
jgi:hypothetical protein